MMDATGDDPVEMIAKLARGITAERRGRFLDAACAGDASLRAEIEARLGESPKPGKGEQPPDMATDQAVNPEPASIDSVALEALSETAGPPESRPTESEPAVTEGLADRRLL